MRFDMCRMTATHFIHFEQHIRFILKKHIPRFLLCTTHFLLISTHYLVNVRTSTESSCPELHTHGGTIDRNRNINP